LLTGEIVTVKNRGKKTKGHKELSEDEGKARVKGKGGDKVCERKERG